jgi:hypothetical protein
MDISFATRAPPGSITVIPNPKDATYCAKDLEMKATVARTAA